MSEHSPGVIAELEAWDKNWSRYSSLAKASDLESYIRDSGSLAPEAYSTLFNERISKFGANLRVLDIGVGTGASSLFLGSKGLQVTAVEPYSNFCNLINHAADKFGFDVRAVCAVAEDLDVVLNEEFDIAIFNASLHHCDFPSKALFNCFSLLKSGGEILLVNESFLRPWRTKTWFYRMLDEQPERMGHYGGNEHVYYNWEYLQMLREAGFAEVGAVSAKPKNIFERIEFLLSRRINGVRVENRPFALGVKIIFYAAQDWLSRISFINFVSIRSSIFAAHFVGTKPKML